MTINTKKFFDEKAPVKDTRFNPTLMDRKYDSTETDKDGNTIISARFMGDQEVKDRLSKTYADMGMEIEGGGYLPNVGKKYVDTAAGIAGGIKSLNNEGGNPLDQVLSASGMTRGDAEFAINSQLEGTDSHYMSQVAKSINLNVDQQRVTTVIQPVVNNVQVPTPVPQPTPVPVKGKTNTIFFDSSNNNNTLAKLIR